MRFDAFDWDDGNLDKCRKHGLTTSEIESVFVRPVAIFPDPAHSVSEARYLAIGRSDAGRHVFLAFTMRARDGLTCLRPISARYMHAKEIEHYEKAAEAQKR